MSGRQSSGSVHHAVHLAMPLNSGPSDVAMSEHSAKSRSCVCIMEMFFDDHPVSRIVLSRSIKQPDLSAR